jgi:signal transduction histidine kinase
MAAGTGAADWYNKYEGLKGELSDALVELVGTDEPGYNRAALGRIRQTHLALRDTEVQALKASQGGHRENALGLLAAPGYQALAADFTVATKDFIEAYRDYIDHRLRREATKEVASLGITFVIFAVSLAVWLFLAYRLERWRGALIAEVGERMRLEEQLLQAQKMEAVGQLASGIAHDFNNLLTAIRGFVFLAKRNLPDAHPSRNALNKLEEAVDQAGGVTRSLLTFGHRAETEKQPVNLRMLVGDVRKLLEGMLPASIDLETDAHEDLWVDADRTQLVQALLNLAINARDAMPEGGKLAIRLDAIPGATSESAETADANSLARIRVVDNGAGMTAEVAEKAFDPFFTTRPRGQGTGLGLAVVHGVIANHDGRVRVDSSPGQGTTITILLPTVIPPSAVPADATADGPVPVTRRASILVAEDHAYVRELIATALREAGHEIIEVGTGPALLETVRAAREKLDLSIIDVDLPGRNGIDCLNELRQEGIGLPAIVITGMATPDLEDRIQAEALLLRKPFSMNDLVRIVGQMLQTG